MKNQSHAAFVSLNKTLEKIAHTGSIRTLREFLSSETFMREFGRLHPRNRHQVLTLVSDLMSRFKAKIGPLVRETATKAFKWNDVMIARLKAAEAKYGDDEDVARALGVTVKAAARARLRYIGPREQIAPATEDRRIAA